MAPLFNGVEPFVQFELSTHEEHFCEINLNLDQWFRRCVVQRHFLSRALAFVRLSRTICAILVDGIVRNNSVKLF